MCKIEFYIVLIQLMLVNYIIAPTFYLFLSSNILLMKIRRNYCLKEHNTFNVEAVASVFVEFSIDDEFISYILSHFDKFKQIKHIVLGEGSNLLFTGDYYGMIIHPITKYISIKSENDSFCFIEAAAGVVWDDFIDWTIKNKAYGLENLSLIPGTVGASAVQNIGAYGAEVGDYIDSVKYVDLHTGKIVNIMANQCKFSYRNSIFKNELKDQVLILSVTYKLFKKSIINIEYADLKKYFSENHTITAEDLRQAVISIRNYKLPDPKTFGNAGSFFKNPVIDKVQFEILKDKFPDLRFYELANDYYKLAAGWLIDNCGLKGFEHKGAAVHENQALVLINKTGNASGRDVLELAKIVQMKINEKFQINLEPEVIIL